MEFPAQWLSDEEDEMLSLFTDFHDINSLNDNFQDSFTFPPNTDQSCSNYMEVRHPTIVSQIAPNNLINTQHVLSSCRTVEQTPNIVVPPPIRNVSFEHRNIEIGSTSKISHGIELSFGTLADIDHEEPEIRINMNVKKGSRSTPCTHEHVMAERNRRERLNRLFVALSGIIPGLKKTDKASLLSDAIHYVKQLEAKVRVLEEQAVNTEEGPCSSQPFDVLIDNTGNSNHTISILKIEARLSEKTVLLRIQCEKNKGVLVKLISEIEKQQLCVLTICVMPFDASTLNITILSKIEEGYSINKTMKDLVKDLNSALS